MKSHNNSIVSSAQKKILCIVILSLFSVGIIFSQTSLPKGAKLKTIKYDHRLLSYNYTAVGYVYDKQFVVGQEIVFLGAYRDTLISGVYVMKNGDSFIDGNISKKSPGSTGSYSLRKGLFKVTNNKQGNNLTTIPTEAIDLKIETSVIREYYYRDYYQSLYPMIMKKQKGVIFLKIDFKDSSLETELISNNSSLGADDVIESSQKVKLNYKNGDVFVGIVQKGSSYSSNAAMYHPKEGEYKFANGDKLTGIFEYDHPVIGQYAHVIYIPSKSETVFSDGTTASGNWLSQYNFTDKEWGQIRASCPCKSPTEIRDMAIRFDKERNQKVEENRLAKAQVEKQEQIAEQDRKNILVKKYGNYWGNLVYNEEFTPGMTKAMVREILEKQRHENYYKKSVSTISGNIVEMWEFDTSLLRVSSGEGALSIQKQCPTLVFKNEKLTDIYR